MEISTCDLPSPCTDPIEVIFAQRYLSIMKSTFKISNYWAIEPKKIINKIGRPKNNLDNIFLSIYCFQFNSFESVKSIYIEYIPVLWYFI